MNEKLSESFGALVGRHVHTLILGTMPGQKSLQLQQYYAHPRNALWPILCAMVKGNAPAYAIHQELSYEERCTLINDAGFGLWDVLARCERPGSLDASISRQSEEPNDIEALIIQHPELRTIVCNGRTAHALLKRHILPKLSYPRLDSHLPRIVCLPSTSPAMAKLSLDEKFIQWSDALLPLPTTVLDLVEPHTSDSAY